MTLGIDPGTRKCGLALVERADAPPVVLEIVPLDGLAERLAALCAAYPITLAAIGRGTNSAHVVRLVAACGLRYEIFDER